MELYKEIFEDCKERNGEKETMTLIVYVTEKKPRLLYIFR